MVFRWPLLVNAPGPAITLNPPPLSPRVRTPFCVTALAAPRLNDRLAEGRTSVCVPFGPPRVSEWTEKLPLRITVYVSATAGGFVAVVAVMQASSPLPGTVPGDQLPP